MLTGVIDSGQALPTREASTSTVTTRPGVYKRQALEKLVLSDLYPVVAKCGWCVLVDRGGELDLSGLAQSYLELV